MPPGPSNIRMPGGDWPAVGADPSRVAARFLAVLRALVVQPTKRLKLAKEEFLLIKAPFKSPTLSTSSTRSGHGAAENPAVQRSSTRGVEAGWIGLGISLNQCEHRAG